ncbi:MAG: hypothetical protein HGA87_07385 [Desulfobulbaceae bacterium]|nr:hypothetical protein [Desulfobulbaceae bacterium]
MFAGLIAQFKQKMVVLTDKGFVSHRGNPDNMMVCGQKRWNVRMAVEVVLSMLTTVCHCKKMRHPVADYFEARLAYTLSLFNVLAQWHGLRPDEHGFVRLSIV